MNVYSLTALQQQRAETAWDLRGSQQEGSVTTVSLCRAQQHQSHLRISKTQVTSPVNQDLCLCVCVHSCARCVNVFVCIYVCLFMNICVYAHEHAFACDYMSAHAHMCEYVCSFMSPCMCVHSACICLYQTLWKNILLSCTCNNYNHWSQWKATFSPK